MSFVQRAFTPPGTGGQEAQQIIAQAEARDAAAAAQKASAPPSVPTIGPAPPAPPQFMPGQAPGAKQRAQVTGTTMLGAAAAGGQQAKKTLLGG